MPTTVPDLGSLTPTQRAVFDFIGEFIAGNGYSPTVREIAARFRWGSPNASMTHLRPMRKKGVIDWKDGCSRTLRRLVDPAD